MTGVFGKRFFNYLKTSDFVEYVGLTQDGRRATYRIKKDLMDMRYMKEEEIK